MSHFTVTVIGPNPEGQLKPYDEGIEMPEYKTGPVSKKDKEQFIKYYTNPAKEGYSPKYKTYTFEKLYKLKGQDWNRNMWKLSSKGIKSTWYNYSTYNPKSKWDWYTLGGRWNNEILKIKSPKGETVGTNQALKRNIINLNKVHTWAVVKNSEWYEQGEMGWFGMSINEISNKEWHAKIKQLLKSTSDDTLISIFDCHI